MKAWKELAGAVEGCQEGNKITTVRAAMDEGTARAIRDALTREVQEEAAKLLDDVSKGTLNDAQLQSPGAAVASPGGPRGPVQSASSTRGWRG